VWVRVSDADGPSSARLPFQLPEKIRPNKNGAVRAIWIICGELSLERRIRLPEFYCQPRRKLHSCLHPPRSQIHG
jgi:hypothetical protein